MKILLPVAVAALLSWTGVARASLLTNGSFEESSVNTAQSLNGFLTLGTGNNSITGWTVGSGSVDYIGSYWMAADLTHSVDLAGDGPGSIYQDFLTTPGQTYTVSFDKAGNPDGVGSTKTLEAYINNVPTYSSTFDTTGKSKTAMGWTSDSFTFTATTGTTRLTFADVGTGPYGFAIDNAAVSAVPIPASLPLFGGALLALGGFAVIRRRRSWSGPTLMGTAA